MQQEAHGRAERAQAVDDARAEPDRGGVLEVARGDRAPRPPAGRTAPPGRSPRCRRRSRWSCAGRERSPGSAGCRRGTRCGTPRSAAPSPGSRSVVRKRLAIRFQSGMPPRAAPARDHHARAQDHVRAALANRPDHLGDDRRIVLAVGVEHHHDRRPVAQRLHVAGLLVAAVADVVGVADGLQVQPPRRLERRRRGCGRPPPRSRRSSPSGWRGKCPRASCAALYAGITMTTLSAVASPERASAAATLARSSEPLILTASIGPKEPC